MTADQQVGEVSLRKEVVDASIKGIAIRAYKFKQACTISTTNASKNFFYRESSAALTSNIASGESGMQGIPRGAAFPHASVEFEKIPSWLEKFGLQDNIFWEDIKFDDISVQARTLYKLSEGVVKKVDDEIWDKISQSQSGTDIHSFTIPTASATHGAWDTASAAVVKDLMKAKRYISTYNYPTNNLICFVNPYDYASIVTYVIDSGAQFDKLGDEVARNGRVPGLVGMRFVESNSVTASTALVCVPKLCATWKAAVPLSTDVTVDPFRSTRIRVVEMGVTQLTTPKSVVIIKNTAEST